MPLNKVISKGRAFPFLITRRVLAEREILSIPILATTVTIARHHYQLSIGKVYFDTVMILYSILLFVKIDPRHMNIQ